MTVYITKRRLLVKLANGERGDRRLEEDFFYYCKNDFKRNTTSENGQHIGFAAIVD